MEAKIYCLGNHFWVLSYLCLERWHYPLQSHPNWHWSLFVHCTWVPCNLTSIHYQPAGQSEFLTIQEEGYSSQYYKWCANFKLGWQTTMDAQLWPCGWWSRDNQARGSVMVQSMLSSRTMKTRNKGSGEWVNALLHVVWVHHNHSFSLSHSHQPLNQSMNKKLTSSTSTLLQLHTSLPVSMASPNHTGKHHHPSIHSSLCTYAI